MDETHEQYTAYIQGKFFKTGLYTHLHIHMIDAESTDGLLVQWTFTFQDLGSTHILTRAPAFVTLDPVTGAIRVDGVESSDLGQAEAAIFQDHYPNYVRELYEFEGITM